MALCVPAGLVIEDPSTRPFVLIHHTGMCPTGDSGTFLRDTPGRGRGAETPVGRSTGLLLESKMLI